MEIKKVELKQTDVNHNGEDYIESTVRLLNDKNYIDMILFSDSLDLYIRFFSIEDKTFEITKEDSYVYDKFSELYDRIKTSEVYSEKDFDLKTTTVQETEYQKKLVQDSNKRAKKRGHHNELFKDDVITIKTEDDLDIDTLRIEKEEDKFKLAFDMNPSIIRIANIGGHYRPYNFVFMDLFNNLMKNNEKDKVRKR